ncbi:MAG: type II toxin-antitoxin system ParD family antitoxin [Acidobacteriaceae bacterium]|nr:type II toxin-antitoxin system ParD family antitoxin [Acidobacteriaceae bacterium]
MNVSLTPDLERFVQEKVQGGHYRSASEVVREALRTFVREQEQNDAKMAALRTAIDKGDASGVAKGDPFTRVRKELKLPKTRR